MVEHIIWVYLSSQLECTKCWIALVARAYHCYSRTLQFSCISQVWVTARFDILFKLLYVTKTINIFLAHFRFLKKLQIILVLLSIMHAAQPVPKSPFSIDILLPAAKKVWPKISVAYFTKWFQSIFTIGGEDVSFQSPLVGPCLHTRTEFQSSSFWNLNPTRARNHKAGPGSSPTFIFKARFRFQSQIYQGS